MKVKDLINKLQVLDPELEIYNYDHIDCELIPFSIEPDTKSIIFTETGYVMYENEATEYGIQGKERKDVIII